MKARTALVPIYLGTYSHHRKETWSIVLTLTLVSVPRTLPQYVPIFTSAPASRRIQRLAITAINTTITFNFSIFPLSTSHQHSTRWRRNNPHKTPPRRSMPRKTLNNPQRKRQATPPSSTHACPRARTLRCESSSPRSMTMLPSYVFHTPPPFSSSLAVCLPRCLRLSVANSTP